MTCEERIEKLLNRANNTMADLPTEHDTEQMADWLVMAAQKVALDAESLSFGDVFQGASEEGLHLVDVIERLCWALDNTLRKYDRAKMRLNTWGDINFVSDLEEGKI